jgi:hypothetical protein
VLRMRNNQGPIRAFSYALKELECLPRHTKPHKPRHGSHWSVVRASSPVRLRKRKRCGAAASGRARSAKRSCSTTAGRKRSSFLSHRAVGPRFLAGPAPGAQAMRSRGNGPHLECQSQLQRSGWPKAFLFPFSPGSRSVLPRGSGSGSASDAELRHRAAPGVPSAAAALRLAECVPLIKGK